MIGGRILADGARIVWSILIITGFAMVLGFRLGGGAAGALGALALVTAFGLTMRWPMAFIGHHGPHDRIANTWGFMIILPLTFASSAFVPVDTMPGWLQPIAEVNPVTAAIDAARGLMLGVARHRAGDEVGDLDGRDPGGVRAAGDRGATAAAPREYPVRSGDRPSPVDELAQDVHVTGVASAIHGLENESLHVILDRTTWSLKVRRPGARAAAMAGPSRGGQARLPARGPQQAAIVDTVPRCRCDGIRHRRAPSNRSSWSRGSATSVRSRRSPNAEDGIWRRKDLRRGDGGFEERHAVPEDVRPQGLDVRLADFATPPRGDFMARCGRPRSDLTRADLERLGLLRVRRRSRGRADLFTSRRCRGTSRHRAGDRVSFRTFQRQPEWRGRSVEEQLRRFFGTYWRGRKIRSAPALVEALDLTRVPRPLDQVLAHV